ncbi:MAG: hypothetical protein Q8O67_02870 [Deltaproteobacteria bacterium]|nr:hypothetical protein [Deltaproteobacteria bacterium]
MVRLALPDAVVPTTVAISSTAGSDTVESYVRERMTAWGAKVVDDGADLLLRLEVTDEGRTVSIDLSSAEGTSTRAIHGDDVDEAHALVWLVVRAALERASRAAAVVVVEPVVPPVAVPVVLDLAPFVPPKPKPELEVEATAPVAPAPPPVPSLVRLRVIGRSAPGIPGILPLPVGVGVGVDVGDTVALGIEGGWQLAVADDVVVHEIPLAIKAEWRATPTMALGVRGSFAPAIGVGTAKDVGVGVGVGVAMGAFARLRLPLVSDPLPLALAVEVGVEVRPLRPAFTTGKGVVLSDLIAVPLGLAFEIDPPARAVSP